MSSLETQLKKARREVVSDGYEMSVGEVVSLYKDGELCINPNFQRLFRWDEGRKTRFIESLLLGIPIPPIFVFQRADGVWELIDGLQRTSTILEFMGELLGSDGDRLPGSALLATKLLPSLDGVTWEATSAPCLISAQKLDRGMHLTPETPTYSMRGCGVTTRGRWRSLRGVLPLTQACREYLMQLRWPQGFVCPRCGGRRARPSRRGLTAVWAMRLSGFGDGGHDFPGHAPAAAHLVSDHVVGDQPEKRGERTGTAKASWVWERYRTAWALLHKLRRAMVRPGRERLSGRRGGRRDLCGGRRRGTARTAVFQKKVTGSHRRRGRRRGDRKDPYEAHPRSVQATAARLHPRGCRARQHDPHRRLGRVRRPGGAWLSARVRHFLAGSSQSASELLPHVHRVAALLKRWLIGTHQGRCEP